ncbi:pyridoxine 5'-phosphate synthase [Helicobacter himalayensis]|uniref:pyridoxine 5'-phosphate synthase n=1 Tax=Helicobacter himalayensis TaxID=1591088 RepID=UPI0008308B89|nr:pyridoxine 5'-phosphate synthase [Helicobacter himalayensis]
MTLGVNIDHIATLRQARAINEPNPLEAIFIIKNAGAHQITMHLREDRRHIQDDDVRAVISAAPLPVNVECALDSHIIELLCALKPNRITLVPEKREEVTTEGGLNLEKNFANIKNTLAEFHKHNIATSLFIEPNEMMIESAKELGAGAIELHTGKYANIFLMQTTNLSRTNASIAELELPQEELKSLLDSEILLLQNAAKKATTLNLACFAGHGLNANNLEPIVRIKEISELNIGHSIIARAVFVGLERAIKDILEQLPTP